MNYLKNFCKILLFCSILITIQSCRSSKNILSSDGSVIDKSQEQLLDDILKAELDYKNISGKISLELIAGSKLSGVKTNSQLKIIKNKIVQLSIRAPFINSEVIRLNITPDSVILIDRMNKVYAAENIKKMGKENNVHFNFNNMQSLFTNMLFTPGKEQISRSDYNNYDISVDSEKYKLVTKDKSGIIYTFTVDSNDRITSTNISGIKSKYSLNWNYSEFIKDGVFIYPTKMEAAVMISNKNVRLSMNYPRLDINKDLDVDQSLPAKYKKVSITDILSNYLK